jgi:hypothetical protein
MNIIHLNLIAGLLSNEMMERYLQSEEEGCVLSTVCQEVLQKNLSLYCECIEGKVSLVNQYLSRLFIQTIDQYSPHLLPSNSNSSASSSSFITEEMKKIVRICFEKEYFTGTYIYIYIYICLYICFKLH